MQVSKERRAAIGDAVMRLERELYGRGPSLIRVSVSDSQPDVITVLSVDTLTSADRTLVQQGMVASVVSHHQAIHQATARYFCEEIETLVGRGPVSYMAQVDPGTGYAVRVFVFEDEVAGGEAPA
ncbi:MAG: Na-translocating system protein MpsC family protein [Acidimicrobiales bacterium]